MTTPRLAIPELTAQQASPEVTLNEALRKLDVLVAINVLDRDLISPPGSPSDGDTYIVGTSATGAWSGQDGKIAYYASGWKFVTVVEGQTIWVSDEEKLFLYDGTNYASLGRTKQAALHIDSPVDGDLALLFYTDTPLTVVSVRSAISGGTSADLNIKYAENRNGPPTSVWSVDETISSESGENIVSFDSGSIPANRWVWLEVGTISGSVDWLETTVLFV